MGLYDRDYGREHEQGVHIQSPQTITTKVVIITAIVYALQLFIDGFTNRFILYDNWFTQPWNAYRLLSYGFLHSESSFQHILINMLVFWMFGQELERKYGPKEFLGLYLWAIVFAGLAWSLIEWGYPGQQRMLGASGGVSAIFALYALNFPHRQVLFMFIIPLPMWLAAAIAILFDVNYAMSRSGNIAGSAHLAGAIAGLYYYKFGLNPGRWVLELFTGFSPKLPKRKPNLRIHDPSEPQTEFDQEVDAILKKINEQGQDSLTSRERRILEQASREYQRKQQ